jgi:phosphopantothenoylcysteine decarboxylase / phosphopantothenate---cysteine ligase
MRVALGISGGIAAYKAAELVRMLQDKGLDVQVVMTRAACEFITPLTLATLSGHKVITEMFGGEPGGGNIESAVEHIAVAQSIDALVIAPATANVLAKMAHGIADDFLTTLCLATPAPVIVAPAMNVKMYEHAATQENLETLRRRGVRVVNPDEGYLACGMTGAGRLAILDSIVQTVCDALGSREDLSGETILVTAGPTQEPIDSVRYISNRSSGKMGYALAEAARRRGARVVLIAGPTPAEPPAVHTLERVHTAGEMAEAVFRHVNAVSVIIMAAAVADFRPSNPKAEKIKKHDAGQILNLEPAVDILAELSRRPHPAGQIVVGFAAETDNLIENAAAKLRAKRLDMVVANDVSRNDSGFDVDTNVVTLLFSDGRTMPLEKMTKFDVAIRVLDEVAGLRRCTASAALH